MVHADTLDVFEQTKSSFVNSLHTWMLLAGSLTLLAVTAWIFMGPTGVIYAFIFGSISLFIASRASPKLVLRMYKAQPVGPSQFPTGHQILNELAIRSGLPKKPTLHIVPSRMINAFAVGNRDESAIALTDQLVRTLTTRELAGVIAHEVAHIMNGDIKVMAGR